MSEDGQALADEYENANTLWTALKFKYSKTDENEANRQLTYIVTFQYDERSGVDGAWTKLKEHRRKLIAASTTMKSAWTDQALFQVLIRALPGQFKATTDTFRIQRSLTVEEKLRILYEVEAETKETETAHIARGKYVPPQLRRRGSGNSTSSNEKAREIPHEKRKCYLCDGHHRYINCHRIARARKLLQAYDADTKTAYEKKAKQHKPNKKANSKGYAAQSEDEGNESESSHASSVESIALSATAISKTKPNLWPVDTGASSHMSD